MEQNHNMLRGISENGGIVFYGVDSTEIVREMERLHKTSAVTTAALGRLLTATSIMGIMLKSTQDSVTVQIKGGGPAGRLVAVSDGTGNVKGYIENPIVELPPRADGHLDVGAAVGKDGTIDVIRDLGRPCLRKWAFSMSVPWTVTTSSCSAGCFPICGSSMPRFSCTLSPRRARG